MLLSGKVSLVTIPSTMVKKKTNKKIMLALVL